MLSTTAQNASQKKEVQTAKKSSKKFQRLTAIAVLALVVGILATVEGVTGIIGSLLFNVELELLSTAFYVYWSTTGLCFLIGIVLLSMIIVEHKRKECLSVTSATKTQSSSDSNALKQYQNWCNRAKDLYNTVPQNIRSDCEIDPISTKRGDYDSYQMYYKEADKYLFYIRRGRNHTNTPEKLKFFSAFKRLKEELQSLDNQCELSIFQKIRKPNVDEILSKLSDCIHPFWIDSINNRPEKAFFDEDSVAKGNTFFWANSIKDSELKDCTISDNNLVCDRFVNVNFKNVHFINVDIFYIFSNPCIPSSPILNNLTFDNQCAITLSDNFIDYIDLCQDNIRSYYIDLTFNHINNRQTGSILTTIHDFPDERLKIQLMEQVFQKVLGSQSCAQIIDLCHDAFTDIVNKDDGFYLRTSKFIKKAFNEYFLKALLEKANKEPITLTDKTLDFLLGLLVENFEQYLDPITHNHAIMQIIFHGRNNKTTVEKANNLFKIYVDEKLKKFDNGISVCFSKQYIQDKEYLDPTDDDDEESIKTIYQSCYLLTAQLADDEKEPSSVIIVDHPFCQEKLSGKKLNNGKQMSWGSNIFICENRNNGYKNILFDNIKDPSKTLQQYPLLFQAYQREQNASNFNKLIQFLKLGEYKEHFLAALNYKQYDKKFTNNTDQLALHKLFKNKFTDNNLVLNEPKSDKNDHAQKLTVKTYQLTDDHRQMLLKTFQYDNKDKKSQSMLLLCLAAIFAKYSSSAIFGKERESPNVLRSYALALLMTSYIIDPSFVPLKTLKDWDDRFQNKDRTFECTAVLSIAMIQHIQQQDKAYSPILASLLPPAWY